MKSRRISLLLAAAVGAVLVTGIYVLPSAADDPLSDRTLRAFADILNARGIPVA